MKGKILLVDDNDDLLLITQIILKGQGYETVLARSIDEAERKLRIHQPALLLLDINVGDEDGRPFCYQIKQKASEDCPRVILMSGDDCREFARAAADDFLPKPFDFNELIEKVQYHLVAAV
jgi:two-component system, OmpR family, response regulator VicR